MRFARTRIGLSNGSKNNRRGSSRDGRKSSRRRGMPPMPDLNGMNITNKGSLFISSNYYKNCFNKCNGQVERYRKNLDQSITKFQGNLNIQQRFQAGKNQLAEGKPAEGDGAEGKPAEGDGAEIGTAENDGAEIGTAENDGAEIGTAENDGAEIGTAENDGAVDTTEKGWWAKLKDFFNDTFSGND